MSTPRNTSRVFVYGTLMRGCGNHARLSGSNCLGRAWTVDRFAMYADGIPYVTRRRAVSRIQGEVYEVDDATLARLDHLESHPDWYVRDQVDVELSSGQYVRAWMYFMENPSGRLIPSGDFRSPARPFDRCYWVVPGKLLAGAYPGEVTVEGTERRMRALLEAGIRCIVNLMEDDEIDHQGRPFTPYQDAFREAGNGMGVETRLARFAIDDLGIPTQELMRSILDFIDEAIAGGLPVYVHCWGGIGRTGAVVGCWLQRHGIAGPDQVIDAIADLRQCDPASIRQSPEARAQRRMVRDWKEDE